MTPWNQFDVRNDAFHNVKVNHPGYFNFRAQKILKMISEKCVILRHTRYLEIAAVESFHFFI